MRVHELLDGLRTANIQLGTLTMIDGVMGGSNGVIVHELYGHVYLMDVEGALFDYCEAEDPTKATPDMLCMAIAHGILFDNNWRIATFEEAQALREPKDRIMELHYTAPGPSAPHPPHLKVVK